MSDATSLTPLDPSDAAKPRAIAREQRASAVGGVAAKVIRKTAIPVCGAASALAYAWLAALSHAPPVPLVAFFAALAVAWAALLVALWCTAVDPDAFRLSGVIAWAILFRAIGFAGDPVLDDDYYRYLWDARSFATAGTPYLDSPADHFDDPSVPEAFQRILDGINNPDIPTIYPPVGQLVFLVSYWIAPGEFALIKLFLLLADLATLFLLIRLVSPRGVLLYAWCPLLIQETAFSGHVDSLGVFLLVAAFSAQTRRGPRGPVWVGVLAALALGTKALALLALPFLLLRAQQGRDRATVALSFAVCLGLVYVPFLFAAEGLSGASTAGPIGERVGLFSFRFFLANWEFNSTGFAVLSQLVGSNSAKLLGAACVGGLGLGLWIRERAREGLEPRGPLPRGDLLYGCLFLFAPVVNPWYLLWLLPFVCAHPSAWGVAALASISLSYSHGLFLQLPELVPYQHPGWVRPAEIGVVGLAWLASQWICHPRRHPMGSSTHEGCRSIYREAGGIS